MLVTQFVVIVVAIQIQRRTAAEAAVQPSSSSSSSRRTQSKSASSSSASAAIVSASTPSNSAAAASGVSGFKLDLDELQKRGLSPDDVLRHIRLLAEGRISVDGKCLVHDVVPTKSVGGTGGGGSGGFRQQQQPQHVRHRHHGRNDRVTSTSMTSSGNNQSTLVVVLPVGDLLERKFVRNRTITCNDGSKSGYTHSFLIMMCFYDPIAACDGYALCRSVGV